jgi:uncharacterized protein
MTKSELIRSIYEWFSKNETEPILAVFDANIEFRLADGHPYNPEDVAWHGPAAVTQNFFLRAGPEWEHWKCRVDECIETDDAVIVEGRYSGKYTPTGRTLDAQVCHVWRFVDGKVKSFHQYTNTAHLSWVMGAEKSRTSRASVSAASTSRA